MLVRGQVQQAIVEARVTVGVLGAVRAPVVVRVRVERIAAQRQLVAVVDAVLIGVRDERVGPARALVGVVLALLAIAVFVSVV